MGSDHGDKCKTRVGTPTIRPSTSILNLAIAYRC